MAFFVLAFFAAPFIPPMFIGWKLLMGYSNMSKLAGFLTLKPIIATPIWFIVTDQIVHNGQWQLAHALSVLPSFGLSVLAVLLFWPYYYEYNNRLAWLLIALDFLCLLNNIWASNPLSRKYDYLLPLNQASQVLVVVAPILYALAAPVIVAYATKPRDKHHAQDEQVE